MTTTRLTVVKRDNSQQEFNGFKICNAILAAFEDVYGSKNVNHDKVDEVVNDVIYALECYPQGKPIGIEDIQDMIEASLMRKEVPKVAKQFVLYRFQRGQLRNEKEKILEKTTLSDLDKRFTINQLKVLSARYLLRDVVSEKLIEDPDALFTRVATLMGLSDLLHDSELFAADFGIRHPAIIDSSDEYPIYQEELSNRSINEYHFERFVNLYNQLNGIYQIKYPFDTIMGSYFFELFDSKYEAKIEEYKSLMVNCEFMPNTPTLMNSGTSNGGLSACFTLEVKDEVDSFIRETVGDTAAIHRAAGGVGINGDNFRPEGSSANGIPNAASGPCSFIQLINTLTDVIKAGGKRRGANMFVLSSNHPDIEKFITMKQVPGVLENFNVSVGIWDDYWNALTSEANEYQLSHVTHHEKDRKINPQFLWDLIAQSAWKSAEPGVLFFDNVNAVNHMKNDLGELCIVNPCGEQMLYANSSCTLGSINISKCVEGNGQFNWGKLGQLIRTSTRFLDNVVSMNKYPTKKIEEMAIKERRIGLGIMGVADALFMMNIPYNSKEGFDFMAQVCRELTSISIDESIELAKERGPAPLFNFMSQGVDINNRRTRSSLSIPNRHDDIYKYGIRNTWNTTIAPTGTIAMIAGCSYGIEPEFALAFKKKVTIGEFYYANEIFGQVLKKEGLYTEEILKKITDNGGSCQAIEEIPDYIKKVFVTAMDIHWADHIMAQGVCQQYIDNSISKTVNLSEDVTVDDVKNAYLLAHETGCKGVTVYRNNSRKEQVLHATSNQTGKQLAPSEFTIEYIKQNVTNPYARERLFRFFEIDRVLPEINEGPIMMGIWSFKDIPVAKIKEYEDIIPKDICVTCGHKLIFVEGCKVCPNCQVSYCNV